MDPSSILAGDELYMKGNELDKFYKLTQHLVYSATKINSEVVTKRNILINNHTASESLVLSSSLPYPVAPKLIVLADIALNHLDPVSSVV